MNILNNLTRLLLKDSKTQGFIWIRNIN